MIGVVLSLIIYRNETKSIVPKHQDFLCATKVENNIGKTKEKPYFFTCRRALNFMVLVGFGYEREAALDC